MTKFSNPNDSDYNPIFDPTRGYDAVPNYDSGSLFGGYFDDYWSKEDWKQWYEALLDQGSASNARKHWLAAWHSWREPFVYNGKTEGEERSLWPSESDYPVFDGNFREWLRKNKLPIEQAWVSQVIQAGDTALDSASTVIEGAGRTTEWLGRNLPYVLAIAGIGVLAYAYKTFKP